MRAWKRLGAAAVVLAAALVVVLPPAGAGTRGTPNAPVQIGLVATLFRDAPPSLIQVLSRPLKALMESQTGLTGELVVAGDAFDLAQKLKDQRAQLGVFHGFEFAWARQKNPELRPLVIAVYQHRQLHAHLVVLKDGPISSWADLKGKVLALPYKSREHCHLYLERRCPGGGVDPHKFFAAITTPASAEDALADVVDGLAQAAIVDRVALDQYQEAKPARANKLRLLYQSEAFPAAVVAYQPGVLDEATLRRFRDGLTSAHRTARGKELLNLCGITAFEEVPNDFEQQLVDIARAYPPRAAR